VSVLEDKKAELAEVKSQIVKAQKAAEYRIGDNISIQRRLKLLYEKERILENQIAVLEQGSTRLRTYINR